MNPFRKAVIEVDPAFELRPPLQGPHYGAALYAAKLWNTMRR